MKSENSPLSEYSVQWSKETLSILYETLMNRQFPMTVSRQNISKVSFDEICLFAISLGIYHEIYVDVKEGKLYLDVIYMNSSEQSDYDSYNELMNYFVVKMCEIINDYKL